MHRNRVPDTICQNHAPIHHRLFELNNVTLNLTVTRSSGPVSSLLLINTCDNGVGPRREVETSGPRVSCQRS